MVVETFVDAFICLYAQIYGILKGRQKSKWRTDARRYCDSLLMCPSVCLELFFSSLLPSYASSINLLQLIVLNFRYSFCFRFILKYIIIFVWECQNSRFPECTVFCTLHFHPKSIFWYLQEALFSFWYEDHKLPILPTTISLLLSCRTEALPWW